jgi:ribosomal protein S6--L-glutamate ligase
MSRERLALLSRKRSLYSTSRLVEAAKEHGAHPMVLDTLRCTMLVQVGASRLYYRGAEVAGLAAAIPRIGASITAYGLAVVSHLDTMGVPVVNGAAGIARSRDKVSCLQLLASAGIDVPRTVLATKQTSARKLVELVGGLPCIIKLLRGTQGVGVMLGNTLDEVETTLQTFWGLGQEVCLQEFIAEAKGSDLRALVVGGRVAGAMRRTAREGEFRSNIHRGGAGKPAKLDAHTRELAVRAAKVIGLEVCGVDLLESAAGPKVMELNSSPGFEGLEAATKKDIAGDIVRHALALAAARRG